MKKTWLILTLLVFALGWFSNAVFSSGIVDFDGQAPLRLGTREQPSPQNWIDREEVRVSPTGVTIAVDQAILAEFLDSNSMDPVLDAGSIGIEIPTKNLAAEQLEVGDIVAYQARWTNGIVIHRIIAIEEINGELLFTMKGDNNPVADPDKITFEEMRYLLVGVIY